MRLNAASVPDIKIMPATLDDDDRGYYPLSLATLQKVGGVRGDPGLVRWRHRGRRGQLPRPFQVLLVSIAGAEMRCQGTIVRSEVHVGELFCANTACVSHSEAAAA